MILTQKIVNIGFQKSNIVIFRIETFTHSVVVHIKLKKKSFYKNNKVNTKVQRKSHLASPKAMIFQIFFSLSFECYSAFCTKWQVRKVKDSNKIYVRFYTFFYILHIDVVLCVAIIVLDENWIVLKIIALISVFYGNLVEFISNRMDITSV